MQDFSEPHIHMQSPHLKIQNQQPIHIQVPGLYIFFSLICCTSQYRTKDMWLLMDKKNKPTATFIHETNDIEVAST